MKLKSLEVANFRNLKSTKLAFSPTINIFHGNNAQGKTNFIEAIYLLSFLKSFRAETEKDMIRWEEEGARIKGEFDSQTLSVDLLATGKHIRLNNITKRALDVLGELGVSSFSPEDILIVTGPPALRRRFLDSLISTFDRHYLYDLATLQKILRSRNRVLYWLRERREADLQAWDEQLAETAASIWVKRKKTLLALEELLKPLSTKLLQGGQLSLTYQTNIPLADEALPAAIKDSTIAAMASIREEEIRRATTLIGPQRDNFTITLEEKIGDKYLAKDIQPFGSRGEQRVAILALKLVELDLIEKEKGERPLLLLDDVLSEFDAEHRRHLFTLLSRQQTFITATDLQFFPPEILNKATCFLVANGAVVKKKPA